MESKCPLWILAPIFPIKYQRHSSLSGIETKSNVKRPKGCGLTIWFPKLMIPGAAMVKLSRWWTILPVSATELQSQPVW